MEYNPINREIIINKEPNNLDKLVIEFIDILKKHIDYVLISGYVSILLGRSRTTEDIDLFIKKIDFQTFNKFYQELKENNFWCINEEKPEEVFKYLQEGCAVRFAKQNSVIPNFEIKFPKKELDEQTFIDYLIAKLPNTSLKISSLERHIAFKKYYLCSDKDLEDARHIEELFKDKINYEKVNKLKNILENLIKEK